MPSLSRRGWWQRCGGKTSQGCALETQLPVLRIGRKRSSEESTQTLTVQKRGQHQRDHRYATKQCERGAVELCTGRTTGVLHRETETLKIATPGEGSDSHGSRMRPKYLNVHIMKAMCIPTAHGQMCYELRKLYQCFLQGRTKSTFFKGKLNTQCF